MCCFGMVAVYVSVKSQPISFDMSTDTWSISWSSISRLVDGHSVDTSTDNIDRYATDRYLSIRDPVFFRGFSVSPISNNTLLPFSGPPQGELIRLVHRYETLLDSVLRSVTCGCHYDKGLKKFFLDFSMFSSKKREQTIGVSDTPTDIPKNLRRTYRYILAIP